MYTPSQKFLEALTAKGMTYEQFEEETKTYRPGGKADYRIELLAEFFNKPKEGEEEWVADPMDTKQWKWVPWHLRSGSGLSFGAAVCDDSVANVASRLTYRDEDRAVEAGKECIAEYDEYYKAK